METTYPGKPTISSIIIGGRRRLVFVFNNGSEMVQQYDLKTHQLLLRKIKKPSNVSAASWVYEMGEEMSKPSKDEFLIQKSNNNPVFTRKDTVNAFQWRIRNLPYSSEVFKVRIDTEKDQVVVETSNKKYYKRFQIPDMRRAGGVKLSQESLSWQHSNNTLVVTYKKPEAVLTREIQLRKEFQKLNKKNPKQNDIQCTTQ